MSMEFAHLCYDIPISYPNQSTYFSRRAVRLQQSNWIIPFHAIPWDMVKWINSLPGGKCEVIRYHPDEGAALAQLAVTRIQESIDSIISSARESIQKFKERADNPETEDDRKKFLARCRATCSRAKRELDNMKRCASTFGELNRFNFTGASSTVQGLRNLSQIRAQLYERMTDALEPVHNGLHTAAKAHELPAPIGADALEEVGEMGLASEIRKVFE